MYRPEFRLKQNNAPILSAKEINMFAENFIEDFCPKLLDNPGELDIDLFLEQ